MQMTPDARAWLDATVRRILARYHLGDAERGGITYEVMSHLHAAGEAKAKAAGRTEVAREDLEAALAKAGGEEGLAQAFVQPLAKPLERAPLGPRLGAFVIDAFLLGIAMGFLHGSIAFLLEPVYGHAVHAQTTAEWGLWRLVPWGFHDFGPPALQAIILVASAAAVLGYFTWLEGKEGRSLGKRALDLRVVRVDGQPMAPREALLRNLAKVVPLLLLLDTLLMLLTSPEQRQRVSDRLAGTIVVRA